MDFSVLAAGGIMSHWSFGVIFFLLGLGVVVFFHELGHFMLAKFVGIKVERFAVGMGPRVFGIQRGETDYCICAFPIGGYVKMLGQEDIAPLKDEEEGKIDPRAYNAKSVGARFAVISAGVIMNLIVAAVVFIIIGMVGITFKAPIVGAVAGGYPADTVKLTWSEPLPAEAEFKSPQNTSVGLAPGDKIASLDGEQLYRWRDIQTTSLLADTGDTFPIEVERTIDGKTYIGTGTVGVKDGPGPNGITVKQIGLAPAESLTILKIPDTQSNCPFEDQDVLVKINSYKIEHSWHIQPLSEKFILLNTPLPNTVDYTVERDSEEKIIPIPLVLFNHRYVLSLVETGEMFKVKPSDRKASDDEKTITLTLPAGDQSFEKDQIETTFNTLLDILGMSPRTIILGVTDDSPADKANLKPGDIILSYADKITPTPSEIRPLNEKAADDGADISILRDGKTLDAIKIKPTNYQGNILVGINPHIDLNHTVIANVRKNSPADKKGIKQGDTITAVNSIEVATWIDVFNQLSIAQKNDKPVTLTLKSGNVELGKLDKSVFDPACYAVSLRGGGGWGFELLKTKKIQFSPIDAIVWGIGEVGFWAGSSYQTLGALLRGKVSPKLVMGPVGMGSAAVQISREGPIKFLYFLALISASLAVINFLPFPVVDGGHAVFLIIEKIMGKPVPVKFQNITQLVGIAMLLFVFVYLTYQDIARILSNMW